MLVERYVEDVPEGGEEWEEGFGGGMGAVVIKHVKRGGTPLEAKEAERAHEKYIEKLRLELIKKEGR